MDPDMIIEAGAKFIVGKGLYIFEKKFTYMRLFLIEGKPFLLPCFFFFIS
jgi:hypothetical protein